MRPLDKGSNRPKGMFPFFFSSSNLLQTIQSVLSSSYLIVDFSPPIYNVHISILYGFSFHMVYWLCATGHQVYDRRNSYPVSSVQNRKNRFIPTLIKIQHLKKRNRFSNTPHPKLFTFFFEIASIMKFSNYESTHLPSTEHRS